MISMPQLLGLVGDETNDITDQWSQNGSEQCRRSTFSRTEILQNKLESLNSKCLNDWTTKIENWWIRKWKREK